MLCTYCGAELAEGANFCRQCGTRQKKEPAGAEPQWETCEIVWENLSFSAWGGREIRFWARTAGPRGSYSAGESPACQMSDAAGAHRVLVEKLVAEGWEPTGERGEGQYSDRFRRLIK